MLKRRNLSLGCRYGQTSEEWETLIDRRELQHMLHLNKKAEIQILSGIREDEVQSLQSIYTDGSGQEMKLNRLLGYVLERLVVSDQ